MVLTANRAEVRIRNNRYIQHAEAVGRTVRLMTRAPPSPVETLVVASVENRMPTSSLTFRRSDVERLENTEVSQIANAAVMTDANQRPAGLVQSLGVTPRFQWSLRPSWPKPARVTDPFRKQLSTLGWRDATMDRSGLGSRHDSSSAKLTLWQLSIKVERALPGTSRRTKNPALIGYITLLKMT